MAKPEMSSEQSKRKSANWQYGSKARTRIPTMRCRALWKARFGSTPYEWPRPSTIRSANRRSRTRCATSYQRACPDRNRWWCGGETGRSLCRSAVPRLPYKAVSDRRTDLLVSTPHRSSQRGFAAVDCVSRYRGRGAHGVSRATTNRPGEGIWLRNQPGIPALPGFPSRQCSARSRTRPGSTTEK